MTEIRDAQWSVVLQDVLAKIAGLCPSVSWTQEEMLSSWRLIPQWIERQHLETGIISGIDIGCGFGVLAAFMAKLGVSFVAAVDATPGCPSASVIEEYNLKVSRCELVSYCTSDRLALSRQVLPPPDSMNAIVLTEVLQYLPMHPVPVLSEIARMLVPGGYLYISTPDADSGYGKVYSMVTGVSELQKEPRPIDALSPREEPVWYFTREELSQAIVEAGLKLVRFGYTATSRGRHLNFAVTK